MSEKRVLIVCWDCNKHLSCPRVADKPLECADYKQLPKRPGPERPPDRHWYKVVSIEVGEQVTDNTPLSAEERAAIVERAKTATGGPWVAFTPVASDVIEIHDAAGMEIVHWSGFDSAIGTKSQKKANCRFMAHSRTDIPRILRHIEALEAVLRWYRDATYAEFDAATCECTMGEADIDEGERAREVLK